MCAHFWGPENVTIASSLPPKENDEKEHLSILQLQNVSHIFSRSQCFDKWLYRKRKSLGVLLSEGMLV